MIVPAHFRICIPPSLALLGPNQGQHTDRLDAPTVAMPPSSTTTPPRYPSLKLSTSMSALSDSARSQLLDEHACDRTVHGRGTCMGGRAARTVAAAARPLSQSAHVPTTTTLSPLLILSPGDFSQETILPSVIVELNAGMKISLIALRGGHAVLLDDLGTAAARCNAGIEDGASAACLVVFAMAGRLDFLAFTAQRCDGRA